MDLKAWAKNNNKFVKLADGESLTVTIKSARPIMKDSFGQEKEVIRYTMVGEDGKEKIFDNGSASLAQRMADLIGKKITLTRHGEGTKTVYEVVTAQAVAPKKAEDIAWEE